MQNPPLPSYYHFVQPTAHALDHEQALEILSLPEVQELIDRIYNASESNSNGRRRPHATAFALFCRHRRVGCRAAWSTMTWDEKKPWYMASDTIRTCYNLNHPKKPQGHSEVAPSETDVADLETLSNEAVNALGYSRHEIGCSISATAPPAIDPVEHSDSMSHALPAPRDCNSAMVVSSSLQEPIDDAASVQPYGGPPQFYCSGSSLLLSSTTWPTSLHTWTGPLSPLWIPDSPPSDSQLSAGLFETGDIPSSPREVTGMSDMDMEMEMEMDNGQVQRPMPASRDDLAFVDNFIQLLFAQNPPSEGHTDVTAYVSEQLDLSPSEQDALFAQFVDYDAMGIDSEM